MIGNSLRAVTGWEGPIVAREDKFIFLESDGVPAHETYREHALHVHQEVNARGGTYKVAHQTEHRSMLSILSRRISQAPRA